MKKINLELGRISKGMRLKFSLILESSETEKSRSLDVVKTFTISGNDYIQLNPHPFITIDISDTLGKRQKDNWNPNLYVTLNAASKLKLETKLTAVIKNFQVNNLYYYSRSNKLTVNQEVERQLSPPPFVIGNKTCQIKYAVVQDDGNDEIEYEGVIFMINSPENFCYLTIDELNLLFYTLRNINMYQMSLSLLTYYETIRKDIEEEEITIKPQIVSEELEIQPEVNRLPVIETPTTIPDLD